MRPDDLRGLLDVITQPVLLVAADGEILAANAAAARLSPALQEGRRLQEAASDEEGIERRLQGWLRQGGPVPGRLDLRQGDETVRHRLAVGRVTVSDDPMLLVHFSHGEQQDRLAQLTDRLQAVNREARYRRAAEDEREEALATERETRQRIERLQALTSAMSVALSAEDAMEALLAHAPAVVGAERVLIELGDSGAPPQPLLDAIETGEPLRFDTPERLAARYPRLADDIGFLGVVVPLTVSSQGRPLGALGFVFDEGRRLTAEDETPCRLIAAQGAQALERARLYDREHRFAETLQRALLPRALPSTEHIDCAVRYLPAAEERAVGGDWYDVIPLGGTRVGLAVGDVAGHGPEAATAMGQMRNALRALATTILGPAATLEAFNRFVCGQLPEEMATAVYLVVDTAAGTLTYANAGHLPPLLLGPGREATFLTSVLGPPVGVDPDHEYPDEHRTLASECQLVVYTDGLVERRGQSIDEGLRQLRQASRGRADPDALCDAVLSSMVAGVDLQDDAAVLVASVSADAGGALRDGGTPAGAAETRAIRPVWEEPERGGASRRQGPGRLAAAARAPHRWVGQRRARAAALDQRPLGELAARDGERRRPR